MTSEDTIKQAEAEFRQADNASGLISTLGLGLSFGSVFAFPLNPLAPFGTLIATVAANHFFEQDATVAKANMQAAMTGKHVAEAFTLGNLPAPIDSMKPMSRQGTVLS
jgi:hypothetical protein